MCRKSLSHTQFPVTFQWSKIHEKNLHIISKVLPDSIGEELELEPGDALLSINGQPVEDVFDYRYLMNDEFVKLLIRKKNGEEWELEVEKEYEDDLGVEFENSLMDEYRSCSNHCIFLLYRPDAARYERNFIF